MRLNKEFLLTLVFALIALTAIIVQPFLQYILGAVLIAYVLYPLQVRLQEAHASPTIVALTLVVLAVVGLIAPFIIVFITIADNAERILQGRVVQCDFCITTGTLRQSIQTERSVGTCLGHVNQPTGITSATVRVS